MFLINNIDDFVWRALLGGIGITLVAGPLGCFIVWRRMAYFGDTLAHSALLGVALGFLLGLQNINFTIIIVCIMIALLLFLLQEQKRLATDTLLGILAHSTLALGLIAIAYLQGIRTDLLGYLFGEILAITTEDLYRIYIGDVIVIILLLFIWRPLLAMTVHEELAQVEGVAIARTRLFFMLLIALVIAIAMKIVGILLITALLIIPPSTARYFAKTPEQMAWIASLIGSIAVIIGVMSSFLWDLPTSPTIVITATTLFMLTLFLPRT